MQFGLDSKSPRMFMSAVPCPGPCPWGCQSSCPSVHMTMSMSMSMSISIFISISMSFFPCSYSWVLMWDWVFLIALSRYTTIFLKIFDFQNVFLSALFIFSKIKISLMRYFLNMYVYISVPMSVSVSKPMGVSVFVSMHHEHEHVHNVARQR
jgi:hypothetical protein